MGQFIKTFYSHTLKHNSKV